MEKPSNLTARGGPLLQERSRQRVSHILAAARRIIADKGSSALTISELASEAKVTPSSIYRYFQDRTAVLRVLGTQTSTLLSGKLHESIAACKQDQADLSGLFGRLLEDLHSLYRSDPILREIWISVLVEPSLEDVVRRDAEEKLRILMQAILPGGADKGNFDHKTDLLLMMEFAQTATLAALDLPALQGKRVIDKAKGWFAPMLAEFG